MKKIKDSKQYRRYRIKMLIRKSISPGTAQTPRLTIFRSNKGIYAQLVDDTEGKTLASASSREKGIVDKKVPKLEQAQLVGQLIAEKAKEAGIEQAIFDRNGYLYHGRIKSLAEAARKGGLKF